jgi:hypothetical protein
MANRKYRYVKRNIPGLTTETAAKYINVGVDFQYEEKMPEYPDRPGILRYTEGQFMGVTSGGLYRVVFRHTNITFHVVPFAVKFKTRYQITKTKRGKT